MIIDVKCFIQLLETICFSDQQMHFSLIGTNTYVSGQHDLKRSIYIMDYRQIKCFETHSASFSNE